MDLFGEQLLTSAGLSGDQHRRIRRRHIVDLLQDVTERTASADDAAEVQDVVDFFLQIGVVRFELLPQPVELGERASVRDGRGGLVREHAQPPELLLGDRSPAEHAEDAQHLVAEDQGLASKACDRFVTHPFWSRPLLRSRIGEQQSRSICGYRANLELSNGNSAEVSIDARPLLAFERRASARREVQADRLIGAHRAHPARTADVSGPGDPDAREGDITLLRESIHKKLQNRVNGALAREPKCEFLQDLEVHGLIRDFLGNGALGATLAGLRSYSGSAVDRGTSCSITYR